MTLLTKLGLGFVLITPIISRLLYAKSSDLNFLYVLVIFLIWMGFCGVFSSLLHYMLPKKRPVEGGVVEDSDSESFLKKNKIGCLISSTLAAAATTTTTDSKKSGGEDAKESSAIGNSNTVGGGGGSVVEPSLPNMALGDGNPQDIDEDLHSRQLAVYGRETMRRLFASNILVSGMQGLGAEIGMDFDPFFITYSTNNVCCFFVSTYLLVSSSSYITYFSRLLLGFFRYRM